MKNLLYLLPLCLALNGCVTSSGIAKILKAAGTDSASFHVEIVASGVVVKWDRANPGTNATPHSIRGEGITVGSTLQSR